MSNIGVTAAPKTYKSWANGYKALIDTKFKANKKDFVEGVFHVDTTDNWEDRIVEIGTVGDFSVWSDGDRRSESDIKEGYDKRFIQVPFGLEIPIGRLFKKFQGKDVRIVQRATQDLADKAYLQLQRTPYSMFGYGFSDTNTFLTNLNGSTVSALGPDGKRLFSTLHPCSPDNSTTWSNALADNAAVGEDALKAMIENLNNQLDDRGEKKYYGTLDGEGYIWVVPLEQWPEAMRVVRSDLRAGTADNDMNVYKGSFMGSPIEVRWVPFLSTWSTTAHFLVAKKSVKEMNRVFLESQPFTTDDRLDEATKTVYVGAEMIHSVGFVSGRGACGSQGTGSGTYSA